MGHMRVSRKPPNGSPWETPSQVLQTPDTGQDTEKKVTNMICMLIIHLLKAPLDDSRPSSV